MQAHSQEESNHIYRKGREERKEDPYRGIYADDADLWEDGIKPYHG